MASESFIQLAKKLRQKAGVKKTGQTIQINITLPSMDSEEKKPDYVDDDGYFKSTT